MYEAQQDLRHVMQAASVDDLVPKNHLVRKIEKVMDYKWIYERVRPYYKEGKNGRPGTDPVVLIKLVLLQHLFGIPSLRQTVEQAEVNLAYRWFLDYNLTDKIPHFATVSYNFCKRFPPELSEEIFAHILNKILNHRMLSPEMVFIDGTQIKASANKKKRQKELVAKTAKIYDEQLRAEVNAERAEHGKNPFEDDEDNTPPDLKEVTVSTTDPESGIFRKGEHKTEFAYEAHTACDKHGYVLAVEVTPGNVHDSVAFDAVYDKVISTIPQAELVVVDSAYKTPWICKRILDDGRVPSMPYKRSTGKKGFFRTWEYRYDAATNTVICPAGQQLRYATTNRQGYREYKSNPQICAQCQRRCCCTESIKCQKSVQRHIWSEYLEIAEGIRKSPLGKESYALRSQTIERVFADAKEKHAMRYTHMRGLSKVTAWVTLKYAAMNLKKLALRMWNKGCHQPHFCLFATIFLFFRKNNPCAA